jgi:glycosyltransferase involved in cell wall biosynthesis
MWCSAQIAVIVPAYNEAERIGGMLRDVPSFVDKIWVIDDGSSDATSACASALGDPRVCVLRHHENAGVGTALRTGYRAAFEFGADVVAVMAGDGQMHPEDLPALLEPLVKGEADYTKGNRLAHGEAFARMPFARFVGNQVLSFCTRLATGLAVHDSQCGYTALHRRGADCVAWTELWHGYGYPNDLLGQLAQRGARVRDVTVRPVYAGEKSGIRFWHALFVIPFVLARVFTRRACSALAPRLSAAPTLDLIAGETQPRHEP